MLSLFTLKDIQIKHNSNEKTDSQNSVNHDNSLNAG